VQIGSSQATNAVRVEECRTKWHVRCGLIGWVSFYGIESDESGSGRNIPGTHPYSHIQGSARCVGQVYCLKLMSIRPFRDIPDALGSLKLDEQAPSSKHAFEILRGQ
jgi:hypothetical protein